MQNGTQEDHSTGPDDRTRTELSAAERRRIALARYRPVDGKLPGWKELERRFGRAERVLQNAVRHAFEDALVKITVVPSPVNDCLRDDVAEGALLEKFGNLSAPIVVDTSELMGRTFPRPRLPENQGEVDDEMHRVLGYTMADIIAQGLVFKEGSVIGLGAGRGVYYTLEALMAKRPLTPKNITVMSVTGVVQPRDYMRSLTLPLDSDYHCWLAAKCFRSRVSLQQVWLPITQPTAIDSTPLSAANWQRINPDCILAGTGVLAQGHRFYDAVASSRKDDILAPILPALTELVHLCDALSVPGYNPVGDICHQLFYVHPPAGVTSGTAKAVQLQRAIEKVNMGLLNISVEQIQSVKDLYIVAGTARKAGAIRELLRNEAYKIRCLCTDKATAALLLQ